MRTYRSALSRIMLLLSALLILPPLLLIGLSASDTGSRWLLLALQPLTPVNIPAEGIHGRLLDRLRLEGITIDAPPHRGHLERLTLNWRPLSLLRGELHLEQLKLQGLTLELGSGDDGETRRDDQPAPPSLAFRLDSIELEQARLTQGKRSVAIDSLHLRAHSETDRVVLERMELAAAPLRRLTLDGEIALAAPHALQARLHWLVALPAGEEIEGTGRLTGDLKRIRLQHDISRPFGFHSEGHIAPGPDPAFDLRGDWRTLAWPPQGEADYRSDNGRFRIAGNSTDYRIELKGQLQGRALPAATLDLTAKGDSRQLTLAPLRIDTLGGRILADGTLNWGAAMALHLRITAEELHPNRYRPELPESLGAVIEVNGKLHEPSPEFSVELARLSGALRRQPLNGSGRLHWSKGLMAVEGLSIQAGGNRLLANGRLARQARFDLDLNLPKLQQLWPDFAGALQAKGQLSGELSAPRVELDAQARGLAFGTAFGARSATLGMRWDPASPKDSRTELALSGIKTPALEIVQAGLKGPGNLAEHHWQTRIQGKESAADMRIAGGYRDNRWQGRVTEGAVVTPDGGKWRLAKAFTLSVGGEQVQLERHCWRNQAASLCGGGDWRKDRGVVGEAILKQLPLSLLRPFLPEGDQLSGSLDGTIKAIGDSLNTSLTLPSASYRPAVKSAPLFLGLRKLRLDATATPRRLETRFSGELRATESKQAMWGSATGRVVLHTQRQPTGLEGELRLDYPDIAPLAALISRVARPKGRLNLDARLGGTTLQPRISGELALAEAGFQLPDLGVEIEQLGIKAVSASGESLALTGEARSGNGRIELKGSFTPSPQAGWPLRLQIQGHNFTAVRLPEAEVEISPDLLLQRQRERLSLSGKVDVPRAEISLKELPADSVQISEDVRIISDDKPTKPPEPTVPATIDSRIDITLGDKVQFSGFGLKTRLTGSVRIDAEAGKLPAGHGALSLVDGTYKAYGQSLTIDRGRILLAGPLDNPGLDIRATRQVKTEIKVGMQVSGNANNPTLSVFSEPPMAQHDALSYLITGRKGGDFGGEKALSGTAAAWTLGQSNSEQISDKVRRQMGLDELNLGGDSLEESAVRLGKQLNPDLYLRYVQGLFDSSSAVELQYRLTDAFDIKASGGKEQSVDLFYQIER
ncbi:MAG: translocation/assembly module TamB domain-containing protein [Gammaproteobacteria bacterium]|nr:translocation/assembly module TamB domain-containing protein [Gammaproteobacteria bacterium]MBU1653865.1 translocation/assembly module TamB domain-containing protein [Gammaproteobacteria bacterium]MBU1960408.1 translocation/assembly module TamB domain-containing protein [Gammaproteobacteria bacterium]